MQMQACSNLGRCSSMRLLAHACTMHACECFTTAGLPGAPHLCELERDGLALQLLRREAQLLRDRHAVGVAEAQAHAVDEQLHVLGAGV